MDISIDCKFVIIALLMCYCKAKLPTHSIYAILTMINSMYIQRALIVMYISHLIAVLR